MNRKLLQLLRKRIRRASLPQLKNWWTGDTPEWAESHWRLRKDLAQALRQTSEGIQFLKDQTLCVSLKTRCRALEDLSHKEIIDQEITDKLLLAWEEPEPLLKYHALICLRRIELYPLKRNEVEQLLDEPGPCDGWLATEAMVYLVDAYPGEAMAILRAALHSSNTIMRAGACNETWQRRIFNLLPEIEKLIADSDRYVTNSAQTAAEMLAFFQEHPD